MFGWLANLLVKGPVLGAGCACSEGKKDCLRKMQDEIKTAEKSAFLFHKTYYSATYRIEVKDGQAVYSLVNRKDDSD